MAKSFYPDELQSLLHGVPEWLTDHCGASVVVVFGCGPSLDEMPTGFWAAAGQYLTIGVNGFPILQPVINNNFSPDIILGIDPMRVQNWPENYDGIRKYWESKQPEDKPLRLMDIANCVNTDSDLYFQQTPVWSEKRGHCKFGRSSVQAAVNWIANEVKPKVIALFGVDYKGAGRAGGLIGNTSHQPGKRLEKTFKEMFDAAKEIGIKIINCSPGTGLKAIPTADWKTIL